MCANSEGSGETAWMCRLTWAFSGRLCDKYHNLMSWLKSCWNIVLTTTPVWSKTFSILMRARKKLQRRRNRKQKKKSLTPSLSSSHVWVGPQLRSNRVACLRMRFIFLMLRSWVRYFYSCFDKTKWTMSSEFGTYRLCEQRRFRRACASAQSRQNLRCSLMQAVSQEEPSDRKPDP